MSYGDTRIWAGNVTNYWGWELSVDDSEAGRKVGGWASSRERAFADAMNQLRLNAVRNGRHLGEDSVQTTLESRRRLNSALNELEAAERDVTALSSELASIAILMQERDRLPDPGGPNFALVHGAVLQYVLEMELAVIALNERWKDEQIEMNRQMAELRRLRDMVPGEWDKCRHDLEHHLHELEEERNELCDRLDRQTEQMARTRITLPCDDDCHHAPMCPRWEGHAEANCVDPNDPNIT